MTSTLNVSKVEPLSGSGTIHVGSDSSNTVSINTTTQAVTMLGNQIVSGSQSITGILTANTANAILTTTSSNFKMADLTTNPFYRTGTWTPILSETGATVAGATIHTGTPQIQQGYYARIGDFVSVHWHYQTPATGFSYTNGADGSGQLEFHGLPFKIHAQSNFYPVCSCGSFDNWSGWGTGYTPMGYGDVNSNNVFLTYAGEDGVSSLTSTYHSATDAFSIWSMHYITDDA